MSVPSNPYTDDPDYDVLRARSRVATVHRLSKHRGVDPDPDDLDGAQRDLIEMKLARQIREAAVRLSEEQCARLGKLLRGGAK